MSGVVTAAFSNSSVLELAPQATTNTNPTAAQHTASQLRLFIDMTGLPAAVMEAAIQHLVYTRVERSAPRQVNSDHSRNLGALKQLGVAMERVDAIGNEWERISKLLFQCQTERPASRSQPTSNSEPSIVPSVTAAP